MYFADILNKAEMESHNRSFFEFRHRAKSRPRDGSIGSTEFNSSSRRQETLINLFRCNYPSTKQYNNNHQYRHLVADQLQEPFKNMKRIAILIALSIAVSKTVAYLPQFCAKQACFPSPSIRASSGGRGSPQVGFVIDDRSRNGSGIQRNFGRLGMGGYNSYYVESDSDAGSDKFKEEIGGRKIDRSKTHMIFGVRCVETNHKLSIATEDQATSESAVVGLQPLNDLEDEASDGMICIDDMDGGNTLSAILGYLRSTISSDDELLEIGADPVVSIALSKLVGATVVVQHPDEQRLRVLEHAHLYFNEGSKKSPACFQTKALQDDEPLTIHPSCSVVLFTSPELVSTRLGEAVGAEGCRVLVPSNMVSAKQLEGYDYRDVASLENTEDSLLEILSSK